MIGMVPSEASFSILEKWHIAAHFLYVYILVSSNRLPMIKKLRTIVLGTVAIAAVIALFATGPVVATHQAQVWFQANALTPIPYTEPIEKKAYEVLIVNKAKLLFGVDLPFGRESPTFIQNVTQLAKMGFDSPENAKLFLQLDSIALNAPSSHPGNVTLTNSTIHHI